MFYKNIFNKTIAGILLANLFFCSLQAQEKQHTYYPFAVNLGSDIMASSN